MKETTQPGLRGYKFIPICVVVFLVLLTYVLLQQKAVSHGIGYLEDRAYTDLAIGRGILKNRTYGVEHGQPVPTTADVAWRIGIAGVSWLIGNYKVSPIVLGVICSVFGLVATLRLGRGIKGSLDMVLLAGLLLALSPWFALDALSGTSQSMATFFAILAVVAHVRALAPERAPLPSSSAICLGLAACIRIEFAFLWIVLALHALSLSFLYYRQRGGFAYTSLKTFTGLVWIAICLSPLIGWNMKLIGIPWPRVAGAPLTLDAIAQGASVVGAIEAAIRPAYAALFGVSFLHAAWAKTLLGLGLLALVAVTIPRRDMRAFAVIPLIAILFPALLACAQPFLGSSSHELIARSLLPLWAVAMAYGCAAVMELGSKALKKGGISAPIVRRVLFVLPAALFILATLLQTRNTVRGDLDDRERVELARDKASQALRAGVFKSGAVVTDEPGWLLYVCRLPVIDLTGELSPYVLTALDAKGQIDFKALGDYVKGEQPAAMFLWTDRFDAVRQFVACEEPFPPGFQKDRPRPTVCQFR